MKKPSKAKGKIAKRDRIVFNPLGKILYEESSHNWKRSRRGVYAHYCFEWDDMLIDETDPEFEACLCGMPNPKT